MKRLKKDYYALPEAAERSDLPIDDFLWLAENEHIMLSVYVNYWPIVWFDKRDFATEPPIKIQEPIKPPLDCYPSGYLNLFWYDSHNLRMKGKTSITEVYAEKEGREFIGDIQRGTTEFRGRQQECNFDINNVFISHEELQRVINGEAGDWETEKEPTLMDANVAGQIAGKPTEARDARILREFRKLGKQNPGKSMSCIAQIIAKNSNINPKERDWRTILRILYK